MWSWRSIPAQVLTLNEAAGNEAQFRCIRMTSWVEIDMVSFLIKPKQQLKSDRAEWLNVETYIY
jgi:hypothetical protein